MHDSIIALTGNKVDSSLSSIPGKTGERKLSLTQELIGDFNRDLFLSRHSPHSLNSDEKVFDWFDDRRTRSRLHINHIPLQKMKKWQIDPLTGNITHESGHFYTVTGVKVRHRNKHKEIEWDQPIIEQPEIGILGIMAKRIKGILHFCLQAKEEPGNIGAIQLSPTVQATYSNYSQVHGGSLPPYVKLFIDPPRNRTIFAKLQSEDGGRFLFKSNRNMIVMLDDSEDEKLPDEFIWLTLRQIANLLGKNNHIHFCTRSILSPFIFQTSQPDKNMRSMGPGYCNRIALSETIQWLDDQKAANHILVRHEGLNSLEEWQMDENGFFVHRDNRFFRIIGLDATSDCREVSAWNQPIIDNMQTGIIGLLMRREKNGRRSFLLQAKVEAGNRNIVQLGPTIQFTPGNYSGNQKLPKPFMYDEFCDNCDYEVLWENWQAEEGARFYLEEHLHRVLLLPDGADPQLPPDFRWLCEEEVQFFLHLGESVNSCARSILSCLL